MEPIITTATIAEHGLRLRNAKQIQAQLRRLKPNTELTVTIEKRHATRSLAQNAFYWSVVVRRIADHTGYTDDEVHEILKAKFLPKRLTIADGNGEIKGEFVIGGTTTRFNKVEFGEYVESIRQWAAEELDIDIPDPDVDWRDGAA